jgi:hypothetical protein
MMKEMMRPGPAFCAPTEVKTKMPVPMMQPTPNRVSWTAPSERLSDFFSAVARMASSGFTRPNIMHVPLRYGSCAPGALGGGA